MKSKIDIERQEAVDAHEVAFDLLVDHALLDHGKAVNAANRRSVALWLMRKIEKNPEREIESLIDRAVRSCDLEEK